MFHIKRNNKSYYDYMMDYVKHPKSILTPKIKASIVNFKEENAVVERDTLYEYIRKNHPQVTRKDVSRWMESHSWIQKTDGKPIPRARHVRIAKRGRPKQPKRKSRKEWEASDGSQEVSEAEGEIGDDLPEEKSPLRSSLRLAVVRSKRKEESKGAKPTDERIHSKSTSPQLTNGHRKENSIGGVSTSKSMSPSVVIKQLGQADSGSSRRPARGRPPKARVENVEESGQSKAKKSKSAVFPMKNGSRNEEEGGQSSSRSPAESILRQVVNLVNSNVAASSSKSQPDHEEASGSGTNNNGVIYGGPLGYLPYPSERTPMVDPGAYKVSTNFYRGIGSLPNRITNRVAITPEDSQQEQPDGNEIAGLNLNSLNQESLSTSTRDVLINTVENPPGDSQQQETRKSPETPGTKKTHEEQEMEGKKVINPLFNQKRKSLLNTGHEIEFPMPPPPPELPGFIDVFGGAAEGCGNNKDGNNSEERSRERGPCINDALQSPISEEDRNALPELFSLPGTSQQQRINLIVPPVNLGGNLFARMPFGAGQNASCGQGPPRQTETERGSGTGGGGGTSSSSLNSLLPMFNYLHEMRPFVRRTTLAPVYQELEKDLREFLFPSEVVVKEEKNKGGAAVTVD